MLCSVSQKNKGNLHRSVKYQLQSRTAAFQKFLDKHRLVKRPWGQFALIYSFLDKVGARDSSVNLFALSLET